LLRQKTDESEIEFLPGTRRGAVYRRGGMEIHAQQIIGRTVLGKKEGGRGRIPSSKKKKKRRTSPLARGKESGPSIPRSQPILFKREEKADHGERKGKKKSSPISLKKGRGMRPTTKKRGVQHRRDRRGGRGRNARPRKKESNPQEERLEKKTLCLNKPRLESMDSGSKKFKCLD